MGFNTTITGPVQIRTRLSTGAIGFPAGSIQPREIFFNRADQTLYHGSDTLDANGFSTAGAKIGGTGAFLLSTLKNAPNGIAPLDGTGYVPLANLPPSITGAMNYQGTWNPNANSPQLLSGVGTKGFVYKISVRAASVTTTAGAGSAASSTSLSVSSAVGITMGQVVTGAGLAAGSTVTAINGTTITISRGTTATVATGQTLTFSPYLDGISQLFPGDQVVFDGLTWDKIEGSPTEVYSVAGQTGDVVLTVADIAGAAPILSPVFAGTPTCLTPPKGDNSARIPTTEWAATYLAPIDAPTFLGVPRAPTPAPGTSTTQIATSAFAAALVASGVVRKAIADAAYVALPTDRTIAYATLTASRVVTLPAASAYPTGTALTVLDESGAITSAVTLTLARAGTDLINGGSAVVINSPYGFVALQSDGASKWTVVDSPGGVISVNGRSGPIVIFATDVTDSGAFGRTLLGSTSQQTGRDNLGIEAYVAVNDASGTVSATTSDIAMSAMSAARTITLPAANTVKAGRTITVGDDSGQCSATNTLTTSVTGADTINGATSDVQTVAFSQTRYRSNGSNKWTVVSKVPATSAGGVDGGTV